MFPGSIIRMIIASLCVLLQVADSYAQTKGTLTIVQPVAPATRIQYGIEKLANQLKQAGYSVKFSQKIDLAFKTKQIVIETKESEAVKKWIAGDDVKINDKKEGFTILCTKDRTLISGADASGVLYGCLQLAEKIKEAGRLPNDLMLMDQPEMVLRGACIGVQKPYYLPGRTVYEYPYTPQTFPWLYDKKLWIQYLDSMLANRMNSLYLWNGHPFASLVRLKEYPYAVEVDGATFKKNEEMYRFLTTEADKRGIWVIQMFYNIIVSKPFAEHHKIKTQDRDRPIMPLIADYTRKSIAAFVQKYPNVGLMVCLGEAMEGTGNDDVEWFTKTIIPGVQDGLKALGKTEEPPIVLRAHDTDAPAVMKAALPLYKNLYTEAKFNGEALTTWEPRGQWAALHQTLSRLGSVQIENVHIMANLEPFRYGATDFIQKSVQGMHRIMGGNGLHLYPQASYWDWPYSADSIKARPDDPVGRGKRLLQVERDWIWYAAWSRYAWNSNRKRDEEIAYWSNRLAEKFGCSTEQGKNILEAYEQSGEIAPKLLRRFGITDGNRQTLTLGMLMTQLINPYRYGLFTLLYESESPVGEMLTEYAEKDWKGEKHIGETPVQIIAEVTAHGEKAEIAIEAAAKTVTKNKDEFDRLKNDIYCYRALADHYAQKAQAALYVLRYKYSNDIKDLEKALPWLVQSIASYKKLVALTQGSYLYANSMQTQQRKIPIRGVDGTFKTWKEVLVPFEKELAHFKNSIDSLRNKKNDSGKQVRVLPNAVVGLMPFDLGSSPEWYNIDSSGKPFSDTSLAILAFAKELKEQSGVEFSYRRQANDGTKLIFGSMERVKVLVGFFNSKDPLYLQPPQLETNAHANDQGQAEIKIANGIVIKGMPPVNIHSYSFPGGQNVINFPKGVCLILGFVDDDFPIPVYDAGLTEAGIKKEIDWLFE